MKLIFNPYYDSKVYVKTPGCVLGEKVVGPQGLLAELELRSGLTGRYLDDFQRAILYSKALKKAIGKKPDLFFAKSFEKDKIGTATIVLGWRDALVKVGWNKEITGSRRLADLALVEEYFSEKGEADRWRCVLDWAENSALLGEEDSLEVICEKKNIEPLYRQLFDRIEAKGGKVEYIPCPITIDELHKKTKVYSFQNDLAMAEWISQQELDENDVVVFNDTSILNLNLALNGKPQVGAENNAIGAIMQFFSLGINLLNKPINVNTLLAYLQLPETPLTKVCVKCQDREGKDYYKPLRRALLDQLLKDNGISDQWDNIIEEAKYDYNGNDISKLDVKKTAKVFINQWKEVDGQGDECTIQKSKVEDYLCQMKKWAKANLYDDKKAAQFNAIVSNCETMLLLLEDEPDTIKTHDLMLWAAQISRPVELETLTARKDSINVTHAVTDIHTAPKSLYWDCTMTEYRFQHELDFLNPAEIDILKENHIEVPDRETLLKAKRKMMLSALSKVKERIIMLECEVIGGAVPVEDPIATELRLGGELGIQEKKPVQNNMEEKEVEAASTKKGEYQVNPFDFKRESESYSSLDTLIQTPFDYVMEYILKLKEYGKAAMDDIETLRGHIAHAYLKMLTEEGLCTVSSMRNIHNNSFDEKLNFLAETQGALLLLEENDLEFKRFKSLLRKSVDVLLDLIEQNHLEIVGAEQKYKADIPVIGNMDATIDYVMTDHDGNYVILDFKWNEGKKYKDKIEQNKALQLAVYRAILEKHLKDKGDNHKVSFTGYFVLPRRTIYTVFDNLKPINGKTGLEVVASQNNADLMVLATNSYTYRMEQIKSGLIEEGEDMVVADLQYQKDASALSLYPLERKYQEENKKAICYGNKNIVLKGGLD